MITVGMNYEVLPGKEQEFESVFAKVLEALKGTPGHGESRLFKDVWEPNSYLVISEWSDEQAFEAFIGSDKFKRVTDWGKKQILAGRPRHEVYRGTSPLKRAEP